ncbi:MAG: hypothetical protein ACFFDF_19810 [Candidatus Odinarchaeota archaeon]
MARTKVIEKEVEITAIKDVSKLKPKKKSKKKDEPEVQETIEERIVLLKLTDGKIKYSLNITGKKSVHPYENLVKPNDIGLKASLTLKIGPNPQKTLDDIS